MKRFFAVLCALMMLFGTLPMSAFAEAPDVVEGEVTELPPETDENPEENEDKTPLLTAEDAQRENSATNITPETIAMESIRDAIEQDGSAYFNYDTEFSIQVYAETGDEAPLCEITDESNIFYADQVKDGMVHVWFVTEDTTVMNGWIKAPAGSCPLPADDLAGFEYASATVSVNGESVLLFVATLKVDEVEDESGTEESADSNDASDDNADALEEANIAPDPYEVDDDQTDTGVSGTADAENTNNNTENDETADGSDKEEEADLDSKDQPSEYAENDTETGNGEQKRDIAPAADAVESDESDNLIDENLKKEESAEENAVNNATEQSEPVEDVTDSSSVADDEDETDSTVPEDISPADDQKEDAANVADSSDDKQDENAAEGSDNKGTEPDHQSEETVEGTGEEKQPDEVKQDDDSGKIKEDDSVVVDPVIEDKGTDVIDIDTSVDNDPVDVVPVEDEKKEEPESGKEESKPAEADTQPAAENSDMPADDGNKGDKADETAEDGAPSDTVIEEENNDEPVVEEPVIYDDDVIIDPVVGDESADDMYGSYLDEINEYDYILVPADTILYKYITNDSAAPGVNGKMLDDAVLQVMDAHLIGDDIYVNLIGLHTIDDEFYVSINAKDARKTNLKLLSVGVEAELSSSGRPSATSAAGKKAAKALRGLRSVAGSSNVTGASYKKSPAISSNAYWNPSGYEFTGSTKWRIAINAGVTSPWSYSGTSHTSIYYSGNQAIGPEVLWQVLIPSDAGHDNDYPVPGYERYWYNYGFLTVYCIEPLKDKPRPKSDWAGKYDTLRENNSSSTKEELANMLATQYGWYEYVGENTGYDATTNRFLAYVFRHGSDVFVNLPEAGTAAEYGTMDKFAYSMQGAIGHYFVGSQNPPAGLKWRDLYSLNTAANPNQEQLDYAKQLYNLGVAFANLTPTITVEEVSPIKNVSGSYQAKLKITTNTDNGWAITKSEMQAMGISSIDSDSNDYAYYGDSGTFTFTFASRPTGSPEITVKAYESTGDIILHVWEERLTSGAGQRQHLAHASATQPRASAQAKITLNVTEENGSLELIKKDADDSSKLLAGAKFSLTGKSVTYAETIKETNSNGIATWTELPAGTYTLKEVSAPAGYDITFTPTEVNVTAGGKATYTATDKAYAYIKAVKVDAEHGNKPLAGAVFTVTNSAGTKVATLTTGTDGTATTGKLPFGSYTIKETTVPTGYFIEGSDSATVTLSHSTTTPGGTVTHTRNNKLITGDVTAYKYRQIMYTGMTEQPLSGAVLRLCNTGTTTAATDLYGDPLPDRTTKASGAIDPWVSVPYGTYDIVEITAPTGYQNIGKLHTFSITTAGQHVVYNPNVYNAPIITR